MAATTTTEALEKVRTGGWPAALLDFVRWAGPRLERIESPEAFYVMYQLCLSELAEGRSESGSRLNGTLVRKPLRIYAVLAAAAPYVAEAFRGTTFGQAVARAMSSLVL